MAENRFVEIEDPEIIRQLDDAEDLPVASQALTVRTPVFGGPVQLQGLGEKRFCTFVMADGRACGKPLLPEDLNPSSECLNSHPEPGSRFGSLLPTAREPALWGAQINDLKRTISGRIVDLWSAEKLPGITPKDVIRIVVKVTGKNLSGILKMNLSQGNVPAHEKRILVFVLKEDAGVDFSEMGKYLGGLNQHTSGELARKFIRLIRAKDRPMMEWLHAVRSSYPLGTQAAFKARFRS
jgi:hypothetical protein